MFDFAVRSSSTNFCVQSSTSRGALRNALHKSTIIITIVRVVYFCVYDRHFTAVEDKSHSSTSAVTRTFRQLWVAMGFRRHLVTHQ